MPWWRMFMTQSWRSVDVTLDDCRQSTDVKLSTLSASEYFPADMVNWTRRRLQSTRDTCSDLSVTSCDTCWRCYGDVVTTLVVWRHEVGETETTTHLDDVWMMMDRYKQQLLRMEMQGKCHCWSILSICKMHALILLLLLLLLLLLVVVLLLLLARPSTQWWRWGWNTMSPFLSVTYGVHRFLHVQL